MTAEDNNVYLIIPCPEIIYWLDGILSKDKHSMVHHSFSIVVIVLIAFALLAGCTSPVSAPLSVKETTPAPVPSTEPVVIATTVSPEPTPVAVSPGTTANSSSSTTQIYYNTLMISMEQEKYALINFEDIGYPYLYPGEQYIVRITSDHNIFAYVIRTADVPRLNENGGSPAYDQVTRTYSYGQLSPLMTLEDVYDDGGNFTVKDLGKYTLVLDTRLSQMDYHYSNEVAKVTVRILKVD